MPSRVVAAGVVALAVARVASVSLQSDSFTFDTDRTYTVQAILSGHELLIEHDVRIRLIGVELEQRSASESGWAEKAFEFTRQFVGNEPVRLHFERFRQDERKQVLAYVFVGERCLNEELLRAGLGRIPAGGELHDDMKKRFMNAESEAKTTGRGVWSEVEPPDDNRSGCLPPTRRPSCPLGAPGVARMPMHDSKLGTRPLLRLSPRLLPECESRAASDRPQNRCRANAT